MAIETDSAILLARADPLSTDDMAMTERRALGWLAVAAVCAIVWLASPFATALLLGALLAFTLEPMYRRLARRTHRPVIAALVTVLASAVGIVGALVGFVLLFIARVSGFASAARDALQPGGTLTGWIDAISRWLSRVGVAPESVIERLETGVGALASRSAGAVGSLASGAFSAMLGLFFAMLTMYVVLRYWPRIVTAVEVVSPLQPAYTKVLLSEFRRVGRLTLSGTVVTGLVQGALATLGFWISGVPQATFFGIATALASLVPAIGTLLVWVPAGVYLLLSGHPAAGGLELLWGALVVVGLSDYVIRPRLVGDDTMPTLLLFIALFGGLEVFGLVGLIMGPVLVSLAVAVLRLYTQEVRTKHAGNA
jgi:predicted PurR-regulated permease PerM